MVLRKGALARELLSTNKYDMIGAAALGRPHREHRRQRTGSRSHGTPVRVFFWVHRAPNAGNSDSGERQVVVFPLCGVLQQGASTTSSKRSRAVKRRCTLTYTPDDFNLLVKSQRFGP